MRDLRLQQVPGQVTLKTSPLLDESDSSMDWENPNQLFPLYDIDYAGIFKRKLIVFECFSDFIWRIWIRV